MQIENNCLGCLSSCDRKIPTKRISCISQRFFKETEYQANIAKTTKNDSCQEMFT
jgi:hypothetical protein